MVLLYKKYYHIRWFAGETRGREKEELGVLWKRKRKVKEGWGVGKRKKG